MIKRGSVWTSGLKKKAEAGVIVDFGSTGLFLKGLEMQDGKYDKIKIVNITKRTKRGKKGKANLLHDWFTKWPKPPKDGQERIAHPWQIIFNKSDLREVINGLCIMYEEVYGKPYLETPKIADTEENNTEPAKDDSIALSEKELKDLGF